MKPPNVETRLQALEKAFRLQSDLIRKLAQVAAAHQNSLETITGLQQRQPAQYAPLSTQN